MGAETAAVWAVVRAVGETAAVKVVTGRERRWAGKAGPRLVRDRARVRVRARIRDRVRVRVRDRVRVRVRDRVGLGFEAGPRHWDRR